MRNKEERIRERAYQLWEEAGRPAGRQEEHWRQAKLEVEEEAALTLSPRGTPDVPETAAPGAPPPGGIAARKPKRAPRGKESRR
jgi:hypothetical protein